MKDWIRLGMDEPLIRFDQYVNDLLPEGALGWSEVRDLVLFRIYENLHRWFIGRESFRVEDTEETEIE